VERTPIASRALLSVGYDPESQTLELEFATGRVYRYEGVPRGTYDWLLRTPNKGAYVARMINERYPFRDVTPVAPAEVVDLAEALRRSLRGLGAHDEP
jgi:hypothetical protein